MSETDSFIDEVSEEVRRDRLFKMLRRYGWIGVLIVLLIVGGASYSEWRKARDQAAAEARGDALLTALEIDDSEARVAALSEIASQTDGNPVALLLAASVQYEEGAAEQSAATLSRLADDAGAPEIYTELAALRAAMTPTPGQGPDARIAALEPLTAPGRPFRLLALEQRGLAEVATGDTDAAVTTFRLIAEDADVTRGLRQRAQDMIVALGGDVESGANADE